MHGMSAIGFHIPLITWMDKLGAQIQRTSYNTAQRILKHHRSVFRFPKSNMEAETWNLIFKIPNLQVVVSAAAEVTVIFGLG